MYQDEEKLEQYRTVWLTKEAHQRVKKKTRELKKEGREVSIQKIINNLIMENL